MLPRKLFIAICVMAVSAGVAGCGGGGSATHAAARAKSGGDSVATSSAAADPVAPPRGTCLSSVEPIKDAPCSTPHHYVVTDNLPLPAGLSAQSPAAEIASVVSNAKCPSAGDWLGYGPGTEIGASGALPLSAQDLSKGQKHIICVVGNPVTAAPFTGTDENAFAGVTGVPTSWALCNSTHVESASWAPVACRPNSSQWLYLGSVDKSGPFPGSTEAQKAARATCFSKAIAASADNHAQWWAYWPHTPKEWRRASASAACWMQVKDVNWSKPA